MDRNEKIAKLRLEAEEASIAADDLDFMALFKRAQLEEPAPGPKLPDFSATEIDPEQVYQFLVEMVGEEKAQDVLLQASADAIEAGVDEMEGNGPSEDDVISSIMAHADDSDGADGADGGFEAEWGGEW